MKSLTERILWGLLLTCLVGMLVCAGVRACAADRHPLPPHVVSQKQHGDVRYIYIHNPLDRAIWAYFECEDHLTTTPIGIGRAHVAEVRIPGIAPDEDCRLNHYRIQVQGQSPPQWTPYNDYGSDEQ